MSIVVVVVIVIVILIVGIVVVRRTTIESATGASAGTSLLEGKGFGFCNRASNSISGEESKQDSNELHYENFWL